MANLVMHQPPPQQAQPAQPAEPPRPTVPKRPALERAETLAALDAAIADSAAGLKQIRAAITKTLKRYGLD